MLPIEKFEQRDIENQMRRGATLLIELLQKRFGRLSQYDLECISYANITQLLKYLKKISKAQTLEDIFHD